MKYVLTILITTVVVFSGAYFYFKGIPKFSSPAPNPVSTQSAVTNLITETSSPSPVPSASPSGTLLIGGGVLSMSKYSILIPSDWQYSRGGSVTGQSDKLAISKGVYAITISQGAFGGGACIYPGDPDQPMAQKFASYTTLSDQSGDNLRVSALSSGGFVVCQASGTGWSDITSFGHINISAPATTDAVIMAEINVVLSSVKKI